MIASLMMYARPELEAAHGRYWRLIREELARRGVETPAELSNEAEEFSVWEAPDLVLSQTCGMPYRLRLQDKVQLVGTPDFGVEGCAPGYYRSALVVRADDQRAALTDFQDAFFAYNMTISQSGYAAPYAAAQAEGFWFADRLQTGGHVLSARAVAEGRADIAALDAVTWRLIQRYDALAEKLRVLTWTEPTPGLPYVCGVQVDREAVAEGVAEAIRRLAPEDRGALGLLELVAIPKERYLEVPNPPQVG